MKLQIKKPQSTGKQKTQRWRCRLSARSYADQETDQPFPRKAQSFEIAFFEGKPLTHFSKTMHHLLNISHHAALNTSAENEGYFSSNFHTNCVFAELVTEQHLTSGKDSRCISNRLQNSLEGIGRGEVQLFVGAGAAEEKGPRPWLPEGPGKGLVSPEGEGKEGEESKTCPRQPI